MPAPSKRLLPDTSPASSRLQRLQGAARKIVVRLRPYAWIWPPIAFGAGVASFFLVERQQWLGAVLALGMLLAWVLLLSENLISRLLRKRGLNVSPQGATAFIAQMIHQETLFFCLPFLLATTVWSSGQAIFTLLITAMALLSILDPFYYRLAQRHRWLYFAFHAQCVFVVVLVTLPIMLKLTTDQSLIVALLVMTVFAIPSLFRLLKPGSLLRWTGMLGLLVALAGAAWVGRAWVPPASLWLTGSALSPAFDIQARSPFGSMALTDKQVSQNGLFAYTAIRAPRGLHETIYHEWYQEGELVDRIPLMIRGGREEGYRAWTHKRNFPESPAGNWRIEVVTPLGQRLGVMRFHVSDAASGAARADGRIRSPGGIPGLDLRRLIAGQRAVPEQKSVPLSETAKGIEPEIEVTEDHAGKQQSRNPTSGK
ncbi:DUF2914 domain-containing protein [Pistricoccus aurantiacus]|uniref:DUF2914 domain-containing protein n=1 Tax=Pistricoccus aurantiacus TaxID=1883414 RepID=A0A5B8SZZ9_9GAMM|nr:DUF2914 domain-containing protein [Pistricoccus aurantiacus]